MSDDNIARFLAKRSVQTKKECDEVPQKITPHQFGTSTSDTSLSEWNATLASGEIYETCISSIHSELCIFGC